MSLCRLLKIAERIDPVDGAWLLDGIERYKSGDPLDVALGLCGYAAIIHRNLLLKKVADILNEDGLYSSTLVSCLLESSILRFETRVLPRCMKNKNIKLSEVDTLLYQMFELKCQMVRKKRQLYEYIK